MVKLSVRQLVELILRSGDIDSRFVSGDRMYEGARAHRALQKSNRENNADYRSEVFLSGRYWCDGEEYVLEGRADGVFSAGGIYTVEEIKTTVLPMGMIDPDYDIAHWGQAQCYAHILALQNQLEEISVQLTYYNLETNESKRFVRTFGISQLDEFVNQLIYQYSMWAKLAAEWMTIRDDSIRCLQFPFPTYRKGQRQLAVAAYRTIASRGKLYVQAPTGVGKTVSLLFPAIKAMGEGLTSKIFYLTAKTITRQVAEEAVSRMREGGLRIKTLTLTAKDKICFCEKAVCRPDYCDFARGHYDRVNQAVLDAIRCSDDLDRTAIEAYARQYQVCPFELSLDLSLLADCVICDYNYVFDSRAYLRRFFASGGSGDYVFLIDEAHNLVDRSREMFSAQIHKTSFYKVKQDHKGRSKSFDKLLNAINRYMVRLRKQSSEQDGSLVSADKPEELIDLVGKFTAAGEAMLKDNRELGEDNGFLQLYFDAMGFMSIADMYDQRYMTLVEAERNEVTVKLFCLDPSHLLAEALQRGSSAILFSATLTPLPYFRAILGGEDEDAVLSLASPFDPGKLCIMVADRVSTRFKDRERSRAEVANLIGAFVSGRTGNYIVYFPSYRYMSEVGEEFGAAFPYIHTTVQLTDMTEPDRELFLAGFEPDPPQTLVAFCVLGGLFAEGIDLTGSRLIGAVVVGVGLPQLNIQQDTIMDYFHQNGGQGYEYAYRYPGMNKVLQAAGRVIRSENDIGAVLLIDERYGHRRYKELFPRHWRKRLTVRDARAVTITLEAFWRKGEDE